MFVSFSYFFFFQLPLVSLTPIPVQESRALQSPPPSCTWEAAAEQSWLESTPRRHYLHHTSTSVLAERKRQTIMELNVCGKNDRYCINKFQKGLFSWALVFFIYSETKTGSSLGLLQMCINHKTLNLFLDCFSLFLFQESSGTEVPRYNCMP